MEAIEDAAKDFDERWEPLLKTDGQWDREKIRNEMIDLIFCASQIAKVYCEVTGNTLSKQMYYADTVIGLYKEQIQDSYDEGYKDAEEDLK